MKKSNVCLIYIFEFLQRFRIDFRDIFNKINIISNVLL